MKHLALIFSLTATCAASFLAAQDLSDVAEVQILSGWRTDAGTHIAAVQVTLAPGWKTYWRAPGASGIPPRFDWSGSENIVDTRFYWPAPQVYDLNGLRTIGYDRQLVLPIEVTLSDPEQAGRMAGTISLGVCQDVCVPLEFSFDGVLSPTGARNPLILAAMNNAPLMREEAGVRAVSCVLNTIEDGQSVQADITMPALGDNETVIIESLGDDSVWITEPVSTRKDDLLSVRAEIYPEDPFVMLDGSDIRVTVLASQQAVDISGCDP